MISIESPLIKELLEERTRDFLQSLLVEALRAKFPQVSPGVLAKVQAIQDVGRLRQLHIHAGVCSDLDSFKALGGVNEDVGMRRVETDPEILSSASKDAINIFVREVLIPRGLVNEDAYFKDDELVALKHRIVENCAEHWKVCWKNDAAPEDQLGK